MPQQQEVLRGWRTLLYGSGWKMDAVALTFALLLLHLALLACAATRDMKETITSRNAVLISVRDSASEQRVQELMIALKEVPGVAGVTYLTREQVLAEEAARDESLATFLERYGIANPFSDTLAVTVSSSDAYASLRALTEESGWQDTFDASSLAAMSETERSAAHMLSLLQSASSAIGIFVVLSLLHVLTLVATLTYRIMYARRAHTSLEAIRGAETSVLFMPTTIAASMASLCCLVIASLLTAGFVFLLPLLPGAEFLSTLFGAGLFYELPLFLLIEALCMVVMATVVARMSLPAIFRS